MRDRLSQSAWWNRAPRNRTQTCYSRFLKGASSPISGRFSKSLNEFNSPLKDALKNRYSEYIGGQDG